MYHDVAPATVNSYCLETAAVNGRLVLAIARDITMHKWPLRKSLIHLLQDAGYICSGFTMLHLGMD